MAAHASAPDRLTHCQFPSGSGIYIPGAPVPAGRRVCTSPKELLR